MPKLLFVINISNFIIQIVNCIFTNKELMCPYKLNFMIIEFLIYKIKRLNKIYRRVIRVSHLQPD